MLGHQDQKRSRQRLPHVHVTDFRFGELWRHVDDVFLIARNVTVERVTLLSCVHDEKKYKEQFHSALTGLAVKCDFRFLAPQIERDIFMTRVNVPELQRKFCVELTSPEDVLHQALAWERGVNNQRKLVSFTLGNGVPVLKFGVSEDPTILDLSQNSNATGIRAEPEAAVLAQS